MRRLSFTLTALLLTGAAVQAAPPLAPRYVSPPSAYHYPSSRDTLSPARRTLRDYFAPPLSYYEHPYEPEFDYLPLYSPRLPLLSPALSPGLDVPLLPRVLRDSEPQLKPATIEVRVPAGAEVWFNGARTRQTGTVRVFESPPLEPGTPYAYSVKARWTLGGKEMERTLQVPVSAGAKNTADFTK